MIRIQNYINGQYVPPVSGQYMDNFEPATGKVYGEIPLSGKEDVESAIRAAGMAFPAWSKTGIRERSRILLRIADLIMEKLDELALAESTDNGKPVSLATEVDIPRAAQNFEFFATAIQQFASESHANPGKNVHYTLRQPLGIVTCISPWNLPLYLFTWKIAPALAAGNCVIAKPSEVTPMSAYLLAGICMEAGLPPGVLNILHGTGPDCGAAMVAHPDVKAISFTGSTRAGREIASVAAPQLKKLSLELGGKNPVLIFDDCDYDLMLQETVRAAFSNQGQICLCGSRLYIQDTIYEKFREDFVEKIRQMRVGDPRSVDTNIGAVVSEAHLGKIFEYLRIAAEEGGRVLCGGERVTPEGRCAEGYFVQPAVVEGLPNDCRTNQEEIFGPVVTIQPFHSEEEVLAMANDSSYGLASVIWTRHLSRAHRLSETMQSGLVWVNCWMERDLRTPFGGMKNSGVGREGGWEALRFFTEPKNVTIQY
ncbi:MAG TPA: aldehyde dehydrogenase [Chitinophagales bacterium]|nr:aldehyde dehydrogenase [Chitinophagales bacterium]